MGVFDVIGKGFSYASKSVGLILILFIFNLVVSLASIAIIGPATVTPVAGAVVPPLNFAKGIAALLLGLVAILLSVFIHGGSLACIRDLVKEGKFSLNKFASYGGSFYAKLLGLGILIMLILLVAVIVIGLIISAGAAINNAAITAIFVILSILLGLAALYILVLFIFSPYSVVVDDSKVIESMKRSIQFAKKNLGSIIGLAVLAILISVIVGLISGFFAIILNLGFKNTPRISDILQAIINSGLNSYISVVLIAAFMAYYMTKSKPTFTPGPVEAEVK